MSGYILAGADGSAGSAAAARWWVPTAVPPSWWSAVGTLTASVRASVRSPTR